MSKLNKKATEVDFKTDKIEKLAGGYGVYAARQDAESLLKRSVMSCLLWEDIAYEDGVSVSENIKNLIPQVSPEKVAEIAVKAKTEQKLRHIPLFIAREMARIDTHKHLVGTLLPKIITRADQITDFLALYWKDGKCPISKQVKIGLAKCFSKFNEYQFAKYNRQTKVKFRDVLFMVHPDPECYHHHQKLYSNIANNTLPTPDTWEVELSTGKDKKETFTRLIEENKIGALAFVTNLRNMVEAGVNREAIYKGFEKINPENLLPLNCLTAAKQCPLFQRELEELLFKILREHPKLQGYTILVVDTSGSMYSRISTKSENSRMDVAVSLAILVSAVCEHLSIYITAGDDGNRKHETILIPSKRGFALSEEILASHAGIGNGGIFTRQCLEYIKENENITPDRIIVFSDSQDCDYPSSRIPAPFGKKNYIVDVSCNKRGINYKGAWTAEISGWSEQFLKYIYEMEGDQ